MLSSTIMSTIPNLLSSSSSLNPVSIRLPLTTKLSYLSLTEHKIFPPIRMGGGPRTYPGGVSKWQWKRMQAKKAKQLLKARLGRERQIYEMRKRAELKAAVSELERPWESVEKLPTNNLFSVSADEQLKVLADRFQKPGGIDLWSEMDGPQLFRPDNGVPSLRFFPKGAVHSVRPYGMAAADGEGLLLQDTKGSDDVEELVTDSRKKGYSKWLNDNSGEDKDDEGMCGKKGYGRRDPTGSGRNNASRKRASESWGKIENSDLEVFDMSLRSDGSYGFAVD